MAVAEFLSVVASLTSQTPPSHVGAASFPAVTASVLQTAKYHWLVPATSAVALTTRLSPVLIGAVEVEAGSSYGAVEKPRISTSLDSIVVLLSLFPSVRVTKDDQVSPMAVSP